MRDLDDLELLDDPALGARFAAFRQELSTEVRPLGMAAVRETVRHRARVRTTLAGTAAAAVLVPAVAAAAVSGGGGTRAGAGHSGAAPSVSAGTPGASVDPGSADLSVTTTDLVFDPPVGGVRHGTLTVTVRNAGPAAATFGLKLALPGGVRVAETMDCPSAADAPYCAFVPLAAGATRVFTLGVTRTGAADPAVKIDITVSSATDHNPANDKVTANAVYH